MTQMMTHIKEENLRFQDKKLFSSEQAAERLGLSMRTLQTMRSARRAGEKDSLLSGPDYFKISRKLVLYTREEIETFEEILLQFRNVKEI